jgi:hypothetical protein
MKHVNQVINLIPTDNTSSQRTHSNRWSSNTQKAMLGLFARFGDLYGELARSKGLEIKREKSTEYTREFQLWCLKLDDIDMEGIARGVEILEKRIITNSTHGVKSWPPSYAEFKGMCIKPAEKAAHKDYVRLPSPKMSDEQRIEKMSEMRRKLGI